MVNSSGKNIFMRVCICTILGSGKKISSGSWLLPSDAALDACNAAARRVYLPQVKTLLLLLFPTPTRERDKDEECDADDASVLYIILVTSSPARAGRPPNLLWNTTNDFSSTHLPCMSTHITKGK